MSNPKPLEVEILGKPMRLACEEEERGDLLNAVALLDEHVQEIRESGKVVGSERIAIMAALNIAHKLLTVQTRGINLSEIRSTITSIGEKIDIVLNDQEKLF
jgi:cell division protein ZapA